MHFTGATSKKTDKLLRWENLFAGYKLIVPVQDVLRNLRVECILDTPQLQIAPFQAPASCFAWALQATIQKAQT